MTNDVFSDFATEIVSAAFTAAFFIAFFVAWRCVKGYADRRAEAELARHTEEGHVVPMDGNVLIGGMVPNGPSI